MYEIKTLSLKPLILGKRTVTTILIILIKGLLIKEPFKFHEYITVLG